MNLYYLMNRKDYISDKLIDLGDRLSERQQELSGGVIASDNARKSIKESAFERRVQDSGRSRNDLLMRISVEIIRLEDEIVAQQSRESHLSFLRTKLAALEELKEENSNEYFRELEKLRREYFIEHTRYYKNDGEKSNTSANSSLADLLRFPSRDRKRLLFALMAPLMLAIILGSIIIAGAILLAFK